MALNKLGKNFFLNLLFIFFIFLIDRISKIYVIYINENFSEICITSKAEVSYEDDVETTAITTKAKGSKCSICWKIKVTACDRTNCAVK